MHTAYKLGQIARQKFNATGEIEANPFHVVHRHLEHDTFIAGWISAK